jgi:hypothetical protein
MNTKYAFNDMLSMPDEDLLNTLMLRSDSKMEEEADKKGVELLKNSPDKDNLANAGLKAMSDEAKDAPSLLGAQLSKVSSRQAPDAYGGADEHRT